MPANKNAVRRYMILDQLLSDRNHYYTRKQLFEAVQAALQRIDDTFNVSKRTIEMDLYDMEEIFGINIDVFRIGGGVILMVCAISLIWGRAGAADDNGDDPGHDIAVVPIAIPMAVGPGTAAGLIVIGLENHGLWMTVSNLSALAFATALLAGLLLLGTRAERLLKRRGIAIITRLTGLFLSAIAAGMILDGVKNFFHL